MNICFRVDSSTDIGTGHVMRCLTLADELKQNGHNVVFISRLHEGNLCNLIIEKGYEVLALEKNNKGLEKHGHLSHSEWLGLTQEEDIQEVIEMIQNINRKFDWIIIDHYAIDEKWEQKIKEYIPHIMIIDDIADRQHNCDILLDQNYYLNANNRYKNLVPENCELLLGPRFALLRDEFIDLHHTTKSIKDYKSILVFYGGSDPTNETVKAIDAVHDATINDIKVHVVVGPANQNKDMIKTLCEQYNYNFHYNIDYMAQLMHEVDFAICAGGSTTWERYCVGTPAIVTSVADNQIELCENAKHLYVDHYIGYHKNITKQTIINELEIFLQSDYISNLTIKAKEIVDGHGKNRVVKLLESIN